MRHEGKKVIELRRDGFVKGSVHNDWSGCFSEFSAQIRECVGPDIDVVVGDFSTTGPVERAAFEVTLMDAMQAYFEYRVMTLCGIPSVTLLGTADDWRSVRERAGALAGYDLGWWADSLLPALDEFVNAASGSPDVDRWQSFFKEHSESGGSKITGWVNALFPYLKDHRSGGYTRRNSGGSRGDSYCASSDSFPSGLSEAPFVWEYCGTRYPMKFMAGFVGVAQDAATGTVRPATGWAVVNAAERKPARRGY